VEAFNQSLFLLINAPAHPAALVLTVAVFLAQYAVLAIPAAFVVAWLRGGEATREALLLATFTVVVGLLLGYVIGAIWPHPRPFAIGLGHTHLEHVADASFPSDHLTLIWAVAFSFLLDRRTRIVGYLLAFLGLPVAVARIYLGVHFPFDMAGAAAVAAFSAWLCRREAHWLVKPVLPWTLMAYRRLFGPLIRRRWVAE